MENIDEDIDIPLSQVPIKLKENKNKIQTLEKEKDSLTEENQKLKDKIICRKEKINILKKQAVSNAALEKRLESLTEENDELQKKVKNTKKKKDNIKKKFGELNEDIAEADCLIGFLLSDEATPTTHTFLSAVYEGQTRDERKNLFKEAIKRKEIHDVIIGGHTKFKASVPETQEELLKVTGLFDKMKITEDYSTVTYAKISIPATKEKKLYPLRDAVDKSRRRSIDTATD